MHVEHERLHGLMQHNSKQMNKLESKADQTSSKHERHEIMKQHMEKMHENMQMMKQMHQEHMHVQQGSPKHKHEKSEPEINMEQRIGMMEAMIEQVLAQQEMMLKDD